MTLNEKRAHHSECAILAYATHIYAQPYQELKQAPGDTLRCFLSDLMHWCDMRGIDFDEAAKTAAYYHNTEVTDPDWSKT